MATTAFSRVVSPNARLWVLGASGKPIGGYDFNVRDLDDAKSPIWPVAIAGFALVCVGQSICFPNLTALISQVAPPDRQGEMLGLNMSGMALARVGGPMLAGQLFALAVGAPFAMAAVLILPGLWFAGEVRKRVPAIA